jgi:flagellar hook protein FlgE
LQNTGNPLNAAIDGNGFFVMQRDGNFVFTRAGQFQFDNAGQLIDSTTKAPILVRTDSQAATTFNIGTFRTDPPRATTNVNLTGTLARTGTATYSMPVMALIDSGGGTQAVTLKFTRSDSDATQWTVEADDSSGKSLGIAKIGFNADGTPVDGKSSITVTLSPADLAASTVTISFGATGSFSGVTSLSSNTTSQVSLQKQDGVQLGSLSATSFDDHGRLTLTYTNGATKTPATLVLAQFDNESSLEELGGGLFAATSGVQPVLAGAQTAGIGRVVGSQLEQSNVDLTQQFSDLIIIQRGYQASSQMTSVANEMIQQLLQMGQHP